METVKTNCCNYKFLHVLYIMLDTLKHIYLHTVLAFSYTSNYISTQRYNTLHDFCNGIWMQGTDLVSSLVYIDNDMDDITTSSTWPIHICNMYDVFTVDLHLSHVDSVQLLCDLIGQQDYFADSHITCFGYKWDEIIKCPENEPRRQRMVSCLNSMLKNPRGYTRELSAVLHKCEQTVEAIKRDKSFQPMPWNV